MNVLLIRPALELDMTHVVRPHAAPLGLLSIATYLKERGYKVRLYDRCVETVLLEEVLTEFQPDVVGISVIYMRSIHDGIAVSHSLQGKGIPVVWGGHMASAIPELVLREGNADCVVFSEGEVIFHELLQVIEKKEAISQVKGIAYLDESGVMQRTPDREFANLADFPVIDWSFVDPPKYFDNYINCSKMMWLYNSKGCPWQCKFCFNKEYNRCTYRKRPTEYIIREIEELSTNYGMDGVYFSDEMFGANKEDLYVFCDSLRGLNRNIAWGFQTRSGYWTREDLQYMYDSGCRWLFFGVESGSPETLKRIRKGIDFKKIDQDFMNCRDIGITTISAFIIGFPDETEEQLRETTLMAMHINANIYSIHFFFAYPGTELYNYVVEKGMLDPPKTLMEWGYRSSFAEILSNYSQVPERELNVVRSFFNWLSFFRKDSINNERSFSFAIKTIADVWNLLFKHGFINGLRVLYHSAKRFLSVAWYTFAYPGVRKKYGLYKKNLGKKL